MADVVEVPAEPSRLVLRLYVAGNAANSLRAVSNARALCDTEFPLLYDLEIVDLLEHPLRALADRIIVTPTLLRLSPPPAARAIGDLSDAASVLLVLAGR